MATQQADGNLALQGLWAAYGCGAFDGDLALKLVKDKQVDPAFVPLDQLRRLSLFKNDQIDAAVRQHWGNIQPGTPEEKLADMRRFNNDLRAGTETLLADTSCSKSIVPFAISCKARE